MSAEFPLRPLTVGEVLDAGAAVLRRRPTILVLAIALAMAEKTALHFIWRSLDVHVHSPSQLLEHLGAYWQIIAIGMGTEAFIFGILGAVTAPTAIRMVTAEATGGPVAPRLRHRWVSVIVTSACVGVIAGVTFFLGGVPWVFWFMLSALATPTLVVDGGVPDAHGRLRNPFALFGRSVKLACRGMLAGRVRLLAYGPWLILRLMLFVGGGEAVAALLQITSDRAVTIIDWALWIILNALLYTTIAGVDAAAHLETRIRTEGLDIAIGRASRGGRPVESVLAGPR